MSEMHQQPSVTLKHRVSEEEERSEKNWFWRGLPSRLPDSKYEALKFRGCGLPRASKRVSQEMLVLLVVPIFLPQQLLLAKPADCLAFLLQLKLMRFARYFVRMRYIS